MPDLDKHKDIMAKWKYPDENEWMEEYKVADQHLAYFDEIRVHKGHSLTSTPEVEATEISISQRTGKKILIIYVK